jgi:hypothetical protein
MAAAPMAAAPMAAARIRMAAAHKQTREIRLHKISSQREVEIIPRERLETSKRRALQNHHP